MRGEARRRPQENRVETRAEGIVGGTGDGIGILNVRLSGEMVSWLDSLVERGLYKSRAEAVREFCREFVELHQASYPPVHPPACPQEASAEPSPEGRPSGGRGP